MKRRDRSRAGTSIIIIFVLFLLLIEALEVARITHLSALEARCRASEAISRNLMSPDDTPHQLHSNDSLRWLLTVDTDAFCRRLDTNRSRKGTDLADEIRGR